MINGRSESYKFFLTIIICRIYIEWRIEIYVIIFRKEIFSVQYSSSSSFSFFILQRRIDNTVISYGFAYIWISFHVSVDLINVSYSNHILYSQQTVKSNYSNRKHRRFSIFLRHKLPSKIFSKIFISGQFPTIYFLSNG